MKPIPTSSNGDDHAHRDEKSTRWALYRQRMEKIYQDALAGHCGFDESVDRFVEAVLAFTRHRYTPRGLAGLEACLRAACADDARLRKALGANREARASRGHQSKPVTTVLDSDGVHRAQGDQSPPELDLVCSARAGRV